ncbi:DUF4169 family protein [Sphingomonas sp.]|jgi:hypothetical protein|uniref:DUF4169 family protein n=1 Tax=Sphingomonas sp. TaxID=28214 RepID=UPI0035C834EC
MAEVVNLRRFRRARARDDAAAQAAANRAAFGRTKDEKAATSAEIARRDALLDGAKREE